MFHLSVTKVDLDVGMDDAQALGGLAAAAPWCRHRSGGTGCRGRSGGTGAGTAHQAGWGAGEGVACVRRSRRSSIRTDAASGAGWPQGEGDAWVGRGRESCV